MAAPRTSGFCPRTQTFHSLRPHLSLPPQALPLSFPSYAFSLLRPPPSLPSNPAFVDSSTSASLSYQALLFQIHSLSYALLRADKIKQGDVAFILSPPSLSIPVLYLSLMSVGVVVAPSNPISSPSEIARQIHLVRPSIIFADSKSAHKISPGLVDTPIVLLDSPEFQAFIAVPTPIPMPSVTVHQSDTAAILFSSGTTGKVKGVMLTHRNLIAGVAMAVGAPAGATVGKVVVAVVPLFHVYGFVWTLKGVAAGETMVVLTGRRFELEMVERFRVNVLAVAPPLVLRMVREERRVDSSSLEKVGCAGAPIGVELIRRFLERFPNVAFAQGYGLTESTGGVFRAVGPEESQRIGSVGRLLSGCEAKIVDPSTGIPRGPCEQGELWVRGPTIMKGYIGDMEATSAILNSDGWLITGDLCYIDQDGFLFVVDRLKELIKYKGFQVPPAELEHLLRTHHAIIDAAVIPYPDNEAGQVPMAFIVRQPNSTVREDEIMEFVAKQVAPYKKIRRVSFVSSIPKNSAGKILRRDLMKLATTKMNPRL